MSKGTGGAAANIEPLDSDNYPTWSVRMEAVLTSKDIWSAVSDPEKASPEQAKKARALIILNVKDHHLAALSTTKTAAEAWKVLQTVYQAKSMARRVALRKELTSLQKMSTEPMDKYVARARAIWEALASTGYAISETEVVLAVLAGLPDEYDTACTVIESGRPVARASSAMSAISERLKSRSSD